MFKWLELLLFGVWGLLLIPLVGATFERWFAENAFSEPNAVATAISNKLVEISHLHWFGFALVFMTGIVTGISLESSTRKAGERKAFELKSLGYKFRSLSDGLGNQTAASGWPDNTRDLRPTIASALNCSGGIGPMMP